MKESIRRASIGTACHPAQGLPLGGRKRAGAAAPELGGWAGGQDMLLRRLNVRTRLIAVIAVPLVLLFAVAGPEVLERRDDAAAAERAAQLSVDAQRVATAVDALQSERTLSAA